MDTDAFEWRADCRHWHGVVLRGRYAHWCPEWDGLPIDGTCGEFVACTCFPDDPEAAELQYALGEEMYATN